MNKSTIPGLYKDDLSSYLFGVSYTTNNNVTSGFIWSDCYIDFTSQGNHLFPLTKTSKYTSFDLCTFINDHRQCTYIVFILQSLVWKTKLKSIKPLSTFWLKFSESVYIILPMLS